MIVVITTLHSAGGGVSEGIIPTIPEPFAWDFLNMKLRKYLSRLNASRRESPAGGILGRLERRLPLRAGNADMLQRREDALLRYEQALNCADVNGSREIARQWLEIVYQDWPLGRFLCYNAARLNAVYPLSKPC
jgi:hypothetical protein